MSGLINAISNSITGSRAVGGGTPPEPPGTLPLDLFPDAAAAYSVRKLRTDYAGAALRVRREDTNEELDIGFDGSGGLDEEAIVSFCSFTNGLVSRWYDQSGEGNDLVQDVETKQPKIYDAAIGLIRDEERPAVLFDGVMDNLQVNITDIAQPFTGFFMRRYVGASGTQVAVGLGDTLAEGWFDVNNATVLQSFFGSFLGNYAYNNDQGLYYGMVNGGSSVVSLNGNETSGALGSHTAEVVSMGSTYANTFYANVKAQEFILYPSNETGNKGGIEADMADYYTDVVPLLDTYGGAAAAYSLRLLSSTYTGAPIAVRNALGVVADIPFDFFGRLDAIALRAHCGSNDGTVAVWYDQSGGGYDAEQDTPGSQPKIYDGVTQSVVTDNGKAGCDFRVTKHLDFSISHSGDALVVGVGSVEQTTESGLMRDGGDQLYIGWNVSKYRIELNNVRTESATQSIPGQILVSADVLTTGGQYYVDGVSKISFSYSAYTLTASRIGSAIDGSFNVIQELIFYPSNQSTNRPDIERNIDDYYNITPEGLLDRYPGAAAAYSLRRLTRDYRGALITARRADGELKDIYATKDGGLDITSLAAWSSGQDATVQVWFDQSGEGNHAEQLTPAEQPKVYDATTGVVTEGGLPVVGFDADFLTVPSSTGSFNYLHDGTTASVFVAARFGNVSDPNAIYGVYGNNGGGGANIGSYFYWDDRAASSRNNAVLLSIYNGDNGDRVCDSVIDNVATANKQLLVYNEFNADNATLNNRATTGVDGLTATGANTRNGTPTVSDATYNMQIGNQGGSLGAVAFKGGMRELVFYASDQSTKRTGIEDDMAEYYGLKGTALLDTYGDAAAAYSLRLLRTAHLSTDDPYAVRVRRSSDNEEADIGFNGFGNLDVGLLERFCDGSDGFVSRWWDQSGNGNNANQVDEGSQPQIVASGSVIEESGEPALEFDGTDDLSSGGSLSVKTVFTVTKADVSGRSTIIGGGPSTFLRTEGSVIDLSDGFPLELSGQTVGSHNLIYGLYDGTNSELANRGGTPATGNAGSGSYFDFHIGSKADTNYHVGTMQEVVIYDTDQSDNRPKIEQNIGDHYNLPIGLLDKYPGAAAAYSLRQLSTSYEGPLVAVRRAVDGKVLDIYPDAFGDLDTATLSSFCASSNGTVQVWYDQSGSGNDADQSNPNLQPTVYDSVTGVVLENGKPAVDFDGSALVKSSPEGFSGKSQSAFLLALTEDSSATNPDYFFVLNSTASGSMRSITQEPYLRFLSTTQDYKSRHLANTQLLFSLVCPATVTTIDDYDLYQNGAFLTPDSFSGGTVNDVTADALYIGAFSESVQLITGKVQELILYNSNESTNRTGIETNINGYYEMYWDGTKTSLLDSYGGSAAAYSLRALSSQYTGPLIRVRRADGAEQDIYATYDGDLNTTALASFCGASDGTVKVWYDQSGSGNDATQTTTSAQPKIYDSVTGVVTENGKPMVQAQGNSNMILSASNQIKMFVAGQIDNPLTLLMQFDPQLSDFGRWCLAAQQGSPSGALSESSVTINNFRKNGATYSLSGVTRDDLYNDFSSQNVMYIDAETSATTTQLLLGYEIDYAMWSAHEVIIYPTSMTHPISDIEENIGDYYTANTPLLDEFSGAAAAYSLRLLDSTYTGAAIRVRRADGAEQDIGFNVFKELDTSALATFCGASDGTVKVWYDQSGSGNDAEQSDPLKQPKIYDSATGVVTENGNPAVLFDSDFLSVPSSTATFKSIHDGTTQGTIYANTKVTSSTAMSLLGNNNGAGFANGFEVTYLGGHRGFTFLNGVNSLNSGTWQRDVRTLLYSKFDASNATAADRFRGAVNGGTDYGNNTKTDAPYTANASQDLHIGARGPSVSPFIGYISELIIYLSDQSANRTGIETNINTFYNIYE